MIDVTPLVREARAPVRKAAEIYIRHIRNWFVGLLAFGSAVKGSFIPGCSDIDLKLYLEDSAFVSKWQLPLQVCMDRTHSGRVFGDMVDTFEYVRHHA